MMSILKKKPRHEVISIRLSEDRLKLLERYQKVLSEQRGREVSLGEAAFLVIEERVEGMDRETARMKCSARRPLRSITFARSGVTAHSFRRRVGCSRAVRADRTEEEAQEPPLLWPAIPSRESYLRLLDAFEAVYQNRKKHASKHAWYYFEILAATSPRFASR